MIDNGHLDPYSRRAVDYARGVTDGEIVACEGVVKACQRFLSDLVATGKPWVFDPNRVYSVCSFVESLPHVKGSWAKRRENLLLEDWQCFVLASPFGFVYSEPWIVGGEVLAAAGSRRFRTVLVLVPRKNGKTSLAAAVGVYLAFRDNEIGAECYTNACKRDQAAICFKIARAMVLKSTISDITVFTHNMHDDATGSIMAPLDAKASTQDGLNISAAICDEIAQWKGSELYGVIDTAMGAREQPMLIAISTASTMIEGVAYQKLGYLKQVLDGTLEDDSFFGVAWQADPEDPWDSEHTWRKANPNYGVSVSPLMLMNKARTAAELPSEQTDFLTKHLNIFTNAEQAWMPMTPYIEAGDPRLKISAFAGERAWVGVDLASKNDCTCVAIVFKRELEGKPHYYVFVWHYLPERAVKHGANKSLYDGWVRQKALRVTPGSVLDVEQVEADLCASLADKYGLQPSYGEPSLDQVADIVEIAYDPMHNATQFAKHLEELAVEMVEVRPTVINFSEPMKYMEATVVDGTYHHNADPVMAWMVSNVTMKSTNTATDVIFPRKEAYERKIDGVVATMMALNRAMADEDLRFVGGLTVV